MFTTMKNAELALLSTTALKTTIDALTPQIERASGKKLAASYAPSTQVAKRVAEGEAADVAIATGAGIDELIEQGRIIAGTRIDVARSAIGVAVRANARKPDISSVEAFQQALLAAKSIGMSNPVGGGASGIHLWSVFERLGIAQALKPKTIFGPGGPAGLVGLYLLRGEVEIGLQQMPELMAVPGIDIVGPVPGELQSITVFAAGIPTNANDAEAGRALAKFLTTPAAMAVIKAKGMQPG
jgi:molybdate transport system substrate-binding protein